VHSDGVRVTVDDVRELTADDGSPVTAASAVAPLGDGWLVTQDDATSVAWVRPGGVHLLRVLAPVEGHDRFGEAAGTKHLKPDLEVACPAEADGAPAVLLLGSGSTPRRMRGVLVSLDAGGRPVVRAGELGPLYERVADQLGVTPDRLNLEGASRHGERLRWFQRGNVAAGVPSAGVDVPLAELVAAVLGRADPATVPVTGAHGYDLGEVSGVGLAVTDAVALPDGRLLLSAAAEDTPDAVDDGPVVASALVLVDGSTVLAVAALPEVGGRVTKVEGLALRSSGDEEAHLLAVVDADDPTTSSTLLELRVALD